ncbi:MAG: 30S ribosome-binding factor RbfA [Planctomycetota bacterium]
MRLKRLNELVRQRASEAILYELKDPRLGFITVSRVELVRDLSYCTIFWSCVGTPGDQSKTRHALDASAGYVQGVVAKAMGTRVTPKIAFKFDASFEKAQKVHETLARLKREREELEEGSEEE